jgi:hypothetical protein
MANPTTNYGWPMPTSTDLVTDLPADFAAFGQPVDTSLKALNPETTLGDIAYRSSTSNTNTRLGIGSTGQVLTVAAGVPSWATPSAVSGPAFRAYRNTSQQSFSQSTFVKIQFNAETFDTANCFDSTTNYRFTPTTAGYYEINLNVSYSGTNSGSLKELAIYKNGAVSSLVFSSAGSGTPGATCTVNGSDLIYFNGSTDYVEGYIYDSDAVARNVVNGESKSFFSGVWIRS